MRFPISDIMDERANQDAKWGEQNHDDLYWLGILVEEVGELSKNIIEKQTATVRVKKREELVQVAAVALVWLECLDRKEARENA